MDKIQEIDELEKYYLQLVEKKQLEFIRYPEHRKEYSISINIKNDECPVMFYENDPPMSILQEYVLFKLFLSHLIYEYTEDWKLYANKAVKYLRKIPFYVRDKHLSSYHYWIAEIYIIKNDITKANLHQKQKILIDSFLEIEDENDAHCINKLLTETESEPVQFISYSLWILSHILKDVIIWGEDTSYCWNREQYNLIEKVLEKCLCLCESNEKISVQLRLFLYYLQGVYCKKTRRYMLSEAILQKAIHFMAKMKKTEREKCGIKSCDFYALLGEVYLHKGENKECAIKCFKQFLAANFAEQTYLNIYISGLLVQSPVDWISLQWASVETTTNLLDMVWWYDELPHLKLKTEK